jgi:hypothetical protein
MMMMIDRDVTVIGLLDFWDVSRGEVKTYSIWQNRLSRIDVDNGFANLDFIVTPLRGMIRDSGFSPFIDFTVGFQERRMQTGHVGLTVMIKVMQRQHGGSFLGLVWDPGITLFDSLVTFRHERVNFYFQEFILGISWVDNWENGTDGSVIHYSHELIHMDH